MKLPFRRLGGVLVAVVDEFVQVNFTGPVLLLITGPASGIRGYLIQSASRIKDQSHRKTPNHAKTWDPVLPVPLG